MDWIERVFGISPDGGSGAFETLLALGAAIAFGAMVVWLVRRAGDVSRTLPRP